MAFDGTASGTVTYSTGQTGFGNAANLASGKITVPHGAMDITSGVAFTWECMVKTNQAPDFVPMSRENTGNLTDAYIYCPSGGSGGQVQFHVAGQATTVDTAINLRDNAWHYLAMVYTGTTLHGYVDGTRFFTGAVSPGTNDTSGQGVFGNYTTGFALTGLLDEVRISNTARYTGATYTVPAAPFTDDGSTVALYHMESNLLDSHGAAPAFTAGSITVNSVGTTTASLTTTAATNGTGSVTQQWYRSTSNGFTPGGGNLVGGATGLTLSDTGLSTTTTYYWKVVFTDSTTATVTSAQATATTGAGLSPGSLSVTWKGRTKLELFSTAPTSGTGSGYTYQWKQDGVNVGTNSSTLRISGLTAGATYSFTVQYGDSGSGSATSSPLSVTMRAANCLLIGSIGNSRGSYLGSPPTIMDSLIANLPAALSGRTCALTFNYSLSGTTTYDWLILSASIRDSTSSVGDGETGGTQGARAFSQRETDLVLVGPITINDAKTDVVNSIAGPQTKAVVKANLTTIISNILTSMGSTPKVMLNYDYHHNSFGSQLTVGSNTAVDQYNIAMNELVNGTTILQGDKLVTAWVDAHLSAMHDNLHLAQDDVNGIPYYGGVLLVNAVVALYSTPTAPYAALMGVGVPDQLAKVISQGAYTTAQLMGVGMPGPTAVVLTSASPTKIALMATGMPDQVAKLLGT